jgi:hypothetical protein
MICTLTTPNSVIDLAGFTGRPSETNGLNIQTDITSQQVSYVGGIEGRQFFRSGSYVSASFSSMMTFDTLSDAEFFLTAINKDLINQQGSVATFAERTAEGQEQIEVATCVGYPVSDGEVDVTFTSSLVSGSPITISVQVFTIDAPSVWATKIINALNGDTEIRKNYKIRLTGTGNITVYARKAAANDTTLNLSLQNGSPSPGITQVTNSTNLAAGVAPTLKSYLTLYDAIAQVGTSHRGATVSLSASITGRTTAP